MILIWWSMTTFFCNSHLLNHDKMIKRYLIQNWDGVSSEANMDRPAGAGLLLLPGPGITPFKVSYLCILYPLYLGWSSCQGRWVKTRWSEWQGFTIIKRGISCTSFFSTDVLSVDRSTIQVLFKNPSRLNLFLQTRTVDKIETRWMPFQ